MMFKIMTLLVVAYFCWWRISRNLQRKRRQWRGEAVPAEQGGVRPVTWLSAAIALFYAGYVVVYLVSGANPPL